MNIIITLAGHSRRFKEAGYEVPKFLIEINGKKMLEHVVEMFDPNDNYFFILNEEQNSLFPEIQNWLKDLVKNCNVKVIPPHEIGPVYSILSIDNINNTEPVIVSYCDFIVDWNYSKFKNEILNYAAAIPSFKGFHPASFGNTKYAYLKVNENMEMIELREKNSFTDDRVNEYASAGIYYFNSWKLFKESAEELMSSGFGDLNEAYVSLLNNIIVRKGEKIKVTEVEKFICWGTPDDLSSYQFWSKFFLNNFNLPSNKSTTEIYEKQINIIPMAGRGSRFKKEHYNVIKPLIQIGKEPMFLKSSNSMPSVKKWIFLFRTEEIAKHNIVERVINENFESPIIVSVKEETSGQAATCLLAKNEISLGSSLLIASCDYITIYNHKKWEEILNDNSIDIAIWTYRMGSMLTKNPNAFAYCKTDKNSDVITEIVEKSTISTTPQNDPLLVGTFWFRDSKDFIYSAENAIENNININGEHYIGNSLNTLIKEGKKIVIFDIDQWISLGDPFELEVYYYWEEHFYNKYKILN
jgi:NDP-sugar pyrophosphorylase family protein